MPAERSLLARFLTYVVLYVLGAEFAVVFISSPEQVTLIWPSAGVAYAVLLHHGIRWWPVIPTGILLTHLIVSPAPLPFIPFSLASNTIGTIVAVALVLRIGGPETVRLRVQSGLLMLAGALVNAAISAIIGVSGMVMSGMASANEFAIAVGKWMAGDVFGIVAVAPFLLMTLRAIERGALTDDKLAYPAMGERSAWALATVTCGILIVEASRASPGFAIGLGFLPLTLLLWSALRFEPIFTAGATTLLAFVVVTLIGLGIGGFQAPANLLETFILLSLLTLMGVIPQMVAAANYRMQAGAAELLRRARTDRLTGLPNRLAFEEGLDEVLSSRPDIASGGALAYVDLDQFKIVNDTASHAAGDEAIRQLSSVMRAGLAEDVLLAHLGADEFGLLWPTADATRAEHEARELRQRIADFRFSYADHVFALTASIGLVPFPARRSTLAEVLALADTSCYTAKELGGNRVITPTSDTRALLERTNAMGWVVRINDALEHDRFVLHGQRIQPFAGGGAPTFEILLRLTDGDEEVLPGRFIPAAERFQLAARIDRHVVERTLQWLESDANARLARVNINLSASTLADEDFALFLRQRLRASPVDPSRICFEVTETSAVRDLEHARQFIAQCKAMGVRFALDDFGTGFCSFGYLRQLDVDALKIDGSFVRELERDPLSQAIVRSIVEIGRVLGRQVVAECVEDVRTGRLLQDMGVNAVQGWAYHRPEPLRVLLAAAA
jgi:diguanylate cyclase (GGDEF)-like protein